jgi:hypothetical protein
MVENMEKKLSDIKEKTKKVSKSSKIEMTLEDFQKLIDKTINEKLSDKEKSIEDIKKAAIEEYKAEIDKEKDQAREGQIRTYKREALLDDTDLVKKLIKYNIRAEIARGVFGPEHKILDKAEIFMVLNEKVTHVKHKKVMYAAPEKLSVQKRTKMAHALKEAQAMSNKKSKSNVGR